MGTSGEIYNVLGVEVPAKVVKKDEVYQINGKTVAANEDIADATDFVNVIPTQDIDLRDPTLVVRILGHSKTDLLKGRHFKGKAIVGYPIANESYIDKATRLPEEDQIEALKPRLKAELKERLDLEVELDQIGTYLVFDWINGM
jgi:adenylate cyclase class IV